jgi:hypothetical protein
MVYRTRIEERAWVYEVDYKVHTIKISNKLEYQVKIY